MISIESARVLCVQGDEEGDKGSKKSIGCRSVKEMVQVLIENIQICPVPPISEPGAELQLVVEGFTD